MELLRNVLNERGHAFLHFLLPAFNYIKRVAGVIAAIFEYAEALRPIKPSSKILKGSQSISLGFMGHKVSIVTTQICHHSKKAATDNT